jgi:O-antigen/teichoic acid export membrane protein
MLTNFANNLLLCRLVLAAIIYFGTIFIATLTSAEQYGYIALSVFLVKGVVNFSLGVNQGLIFYIFDDDDSGFGSYFAAYCFLLIMVSMGYFFIYDIWVTLFVLVLSVIVLLEPYLKAKRNFLVIMYPEAILVISFLVDVCFRLIWSSIPENAVALFCAVSMTFLFLVQQRVCIWRDFLPKVKQGKVSFKKILSLIKRGWGSYFFNLMFFLFLLVDRTLVNELYGSASIGTLMLSYQIALVAGFVVVTMNATAIVDFGELKRNATANLMNYARRRLIKVFAVNLFFLAVCGLFLHVFGDYFFGQYENLFHFVIIIGGGLMLFNSYSAIAPILFYSKKQFVPSVFLGGVTFLVVLSHLFLSELDVDLLMVETINFSLFTLAMCLSIAYVFQVARTIKN